MEEEKPKKNKLRTSKFLNKVTQNADKSPQSQKNHLTISLGPELATAMVPFENCQNLE